MDNFVIFMAGVGTTLLGIFILFSLRPKRKFKVGNILVSGGSEVWHENTRKYKILTVGDNSYQVETLASGNDFYRVDSIHFNQEENYKVMK